MQGIINLYAHASHDLERKNAKFTIKLSATCHAALGRCGELRRSNTLDLLKEIQHTYHDFELKLIYNVQYLQANRLYREPV